MAKIPVYAPQENTQVQDLARGNPAEAGILGNSIASFGRGVSEVGRRVEAHDTLVETSRLAANTATLDAYNKIEWAKVKQNADPNDPEYHNLASKFMDEVVNPNIEALGQNITTDAARAQYDVSTARMRAEMQGTLYADQAHLTAEAVTQNAITVANAYSTGVYADPSSFASTLEKTEDERKRLQAAGLPPEKALEWQTQSNAVIAQSAIKGTAQLNPDRAKADLDSGKYDKYINGEQKAQLSNYIDATKDAKEDDARRAHEDQIRAQNEASQDRENEILSNFVDPKTGQIKVPKGALAGVLNDPKLRPAAKDNLMVIIKRLAEPDGGGELKNDPGTYIGLFDRIHLPDGDPRKLTNEDDLNKFLGHGLNFTGFGQLRGEIQGKRSEEGSYQAKLKTNAIETAKRMITGTNPLLNMRDPKGDANLQRFMQEFLPLYDRAVKAGQDTSDLTDMDGTLGKMVKKYQRPLSMMMQDMMGDAADLGLDEAGKPKPTAAAPPAAVQGASRSATNPKTGQKIYQVGGKWVDAAGKEVR